MKVIVTGGGTGGHVYPALEVALKLREQGDDVQYWGSLRGQEGRACERANIPFRGFPSQPLYKVTSVRGMKGALGLARASVMVRAAMHQFRPDVVFSTGGYASAPVVYAARGMHVPYIIHEQNVVPGRTNRILGQTAFQVCTVFKNGGENFPAGKVTRTGMPIRPEFRSDQVSMGLAQSLPADAPMLLVMGGSQGAQSINEAALATAVRMTQTKAQWLHITGPKHYDGMLGSLDRLAAKDMYELRAFLDAPEMAAAMFGAQIAICRSGAGTLAELAAMRKPSILIPYPYSFGDHQRLNAQEFVDMGAADMLDESNLDPATLEKRIQDWVSDEERLAQAKQSLMNWDVTDSVQSIVDIVRQAGTSR